MEKSTWLLEGQSDVMDRLSHPGMRAGMADGTGCRDWPEGSKRSEGQRAHLRKREREKPSLKFGKIQRSAKVLVRGLVKFVPASSKQGQE